MSQSPEWITLAARELLAKNIVPSDAHAEAARLIIEGHHQAHADQQLSDQAGEISMLNAEAEMWQQRAEIAEKQLKQQGDRLAAAEDMITNANSKHFVGLTNVRPGFQLTTRGWVVYWPANCAICDAETATPTYFDDWYDAYQAAVAANWLPAETADAKGGE